MRVLGGRVLRFDRPLAGGFLSLTALRTEGCGGGFAADFKKRGRGSAAACVEGLCSLRSGGDSPAGLRVVDCPSGNAYKVSVTGFTFGIIWRNKHYNDQPPPVAFPPLVPYGTTFPPRWEACHLILSRLRLPANQVPLPPRSGQGGSHYPSGARLACFPSPARAVVKVLIYNGAEGAVPRQRSDTI